MAHLVQTGGRVRFPGESMGENAVRSLCLLATACGALACGSDATARDAGIQLGDGGADGKQRATRPGSVYEQMSAPDGGTIPIANAKVCIVEHPELACATTDVDGNYTMALPDVAESVPFGVNFTAAGHLGNVSFATHRDWPSGRGLRSDQAAAAMAAQAGFSYPARGSGFIELRLFGPATDGGFSEVTGATATLSPASGTGPSYQDRGVILFGNVAPGRATITVKAAGMTCRTGGIDGVWPDGGPNVIEVPVAADSVTDRVYLWCN
jgi:hypothetical protein